MNTAVKKVQVIKATKDIDVNKKIRVAAYCRVSTDKGDQINSFLAQMRYYADYVREYENMELVDIYADEGITGTELQKREEMKRLIKDCKNKKIDRVVVKSITRFARNSLECIEMIREMKSCGVSILFENDNIDTEKINSEMIVYIKSAFAQSEAVSAARRMSTSIRMRMEDGTYVASSAPYGYRLVNNELKIVREEAEIVKLIFEMYLNGFGTLVIAKRLKAMGVDARICDKQSIRYILTNEKYIGNSLWQKSYTPNVLPLRKHKNRGELPKYYCESTHEAIISKEIFYAVQRLISSRKEKYYKDFRNQKQFFHNKIICRHCGWAYKVAKVKSGFLWVCSKKGFTDNNCRAKTYSDYDIWSAFIRLYNTLKQNLKIIIDETIYQLENLKLKANNGNRLIAEIDNEIALLSKQNSLYSTMFGSGILDAVTFYEKSGQLKGKITELRSRRIKIINADDDEVCIEEMRKLKKIVNSGVNCLVEQDTELFNKIVKSIYVEENGNLTFLLIGELSLTVEMEKNNGK